MREIGHFIGGKQVAGTSGRAGDVFNPNTGEVQAKVALASKAEVENAIANARGGVPRLGGDQSAAARARDVQVPRTDPGRVRRPCAAPFLRARQDLRGLQGRHPARTRGGRVRLRHSASAEGRIYRRRRPEHRSLFDAPAARRRRRHHAVQLPRHDPAVEVRPRHRMRQHVHPQALRARSVRADAHRGAVHQGRTARRRAQCGERRQGSGRRAAHRRAREGDRLRRLIRHRAIHLFDRLRARETRAVLRRREEPHDRDA